MIQCNISAMRVTGPTGLALIYREPATRIEQVCGYVVQHMLNIQTGLGDPSSDVPSSSTSGMVLMGTDLPNVFLLLCSVFQCPPPSSNFGDERVKSMNTCPVVLSRCPPPSSNLGEERVKSMHYLSVSLFCHHKTVSHASCVNATCLHSDCGIADISPTLAKYT